MMCRFRPGKVAAVWTRLPDEGDLPKDCGEVSMYGSTTLKLMERDTDCARWMLLHPSGILVYMHVL